MYTLIEKKLDYKLYFYNIIILNENYKFLGNENHNFLIDCKN